MSENYYAMYEGLSNLVLVFDSEQECDDYVYHDQAVHPECKKVPYDSVKELISGIMPMYSYEFGCKAIFPQM